MQNTGRTTAILALSLAVLLGGCKRDPNVQKRKYMESGLRYEKAGKLREAAIQFSNVLKVDHNYSQAAYHLGTVYVELGNPMVGYRQLTRAVELDPSNVLARIELGTLMVVGRAPDRGIEQARAVLAIEPANADAYALLSQAAASKGDQPGALANLQKALSIDPNRANFHVALAILEGAGGAPVETSQHELEKAVSLDPKNAGAHLVLASILEKKGDLAGAEHQDQIALSDAPKSPRPYLALGALYQRTGNSGQAEQIYRQATDALNDDQQGAEILKDYYQRIGELDRAEPAYASLVSSHPRSVPLKVAYARILIERQEFSKAQDLVTDLSKKNGSDPQVVILHAGLLLHAGKLDDAFTALQKSARNAPDNADLQLLLGRVAMAKGDQVAAEAAFQQARRIQPSNTAADSGLANIANQRHDYTQLAQIANRVIAAHPDAAAAYLWRGTAEANQKQEGAEADLRTAIAKDPANATAYLELGELLVREQHLPEGKSMLEQALQHNPNLIPALDILAGLDLQANQPARAVARIEDQIARSPNNPDLYSNLAMLQLRTKDYNGAEENAQKALHLNPASANAVRALGSAQAGLGNIDGGIATWQHWAASHPNDAGALTQLGVLETAKGDPGRASDDYKKALQLDPNQAIAANNLAYLMVENGQSIDLALSLAQGARRSMPDAPGAADTLAWVYYYKGTYASARDLLEDALKADPNSAAMHYHLGMVDSKLNDKAGAELHLKKAVTLAPNTPTAKQASDALTRLG